MDPDPFRHFFLDPTQPLQRRYELIRAFFVERQPQADIATRFGLALSTVRSLIRDFRTQIRAGQVPPFFSSPNSAGRSAAG